MSALSTFRPRAALLAFALACLGLGAPPPAALAAEAAAAAHAPAPQTVLLRVQVGPDGKLHGEARSLDPNVLPVILQAAQQVAAKLQFSPATKDGRPVSSETTLVVTLGFAEQASGGFGISVLRAQNGPSVVEIGKAQAPRTPRSNGAMVLVSADLRADGTVNIDTFKVDKAELRVPSEFDQSQYEKAARLSLDGTRFMLDKVDGIEIPSRISVPFLFNGGAEKREEGRRGQHPESHATPPSLTASSTIEGIVLPKVDYTAPAK